MQLHGKIVSAIAMVCVGFPVSTPSVAHVVCVWSMQSSDAEV